MKEKSKKINEQPDWQDPNILAFEKFRFHYPVLISLNLFSTHFNFLYSSVISTIIIHVRNSSFLDTLIVLKLDE